MGKEGDIDAPDVTQSSFIQLGIKDLSNEEVTDLSNEDVIDLNIALENTNSLELGVNPTVNLQTIVNSLNVIDSGENITLIDLTNIGVVGIGGENQPTLEDVLLELEEEDNTNTIQSLVNSLSTNISSLVLGDFGTLGIIGLEESSDNIARVNNILDDSSYDGGTDVETLQEIVDTLVKLDNKISDSSASSLTWNDWTLLGLHNVSGANDDTKELNIALESGNSLELGVSPRTNLQLIEDSLNALDQVKYGHSTGVKLTDLMNIGVRGVGGENEPTLEAVNAVLSDNDVDNADNTEIIQDIVDALSLLNSADGNFDVDITGSELITLGIVAPDKDFSNAELNYINNRISENAPADSSGDGIYENDVIELQNLITFVDDKVLHLGSDGDDIVGYKEGELYDEKGGNDTLNIDGGDTVDLSAIHNIETIVLNSGNSSEVSTSLGSSSDKINIQDVLNITDGGESLTIRDNDIDDNTDETIYIDSRDFSFDDTKHVTSDGTYYFYNATDDSGFTIKVEEHIIVD
jgi:hypothetical protein